MRHRLRDARSCRTSRRAHALIVTLAVFLLTADMPAAPSPELLDRVLAVVSGSIITLSDARAAADLGLVDVRDARDPIAVALKWLIERQLVLGEALRYEAVHPDQARVGEAMAAIRKRFPSEPEWAAALQRLGLTEDDVRALVADTQHAQAYIDSRFDAQVPVSEDELRSYYDRQPAVFARPGRPASFEAARDEVESRVQKEHRASAITEWLSRLRRRADVSELYLPAR